MLLLSFVSEPAGHSPGVDQNQSDVSSGRVPRVPEVRQRAADVAEQDARGPGGGGGARRGGREEEDDSKRNGMYGCMDGCLHMDGSEARVS